VVAAIRRMDLLCPANSVRRILKKLTLLGCKRVPVGSQLFCRFNGLGQVPDVRFGSKADMKGQIFDVRFTPKSGHP
jgi:hypothetical protein